MMDFDPGEDVLDETEDEESEVDMPVVTDEEDEDA